MFSLITQAVPVAIIISFLSLIYCIFLITQVLRHPRGDKKMNAISDAIQTGANAYMKRQYTVISIVGLIIFILFFSDWESSQQLDLRLEQSFLRLLESPEWH